MLNVALLNVILRSVMALQLNDVFLMLNVAYAGCWLCSALFMLSVVYTEYCLCGVLFMLSVAYS
jgi:hypothetical protein